MKKLICLIGKGLFLFKRRKIPKSVKRILIIRSGAIGDVLMTTPLARAIRKHYPEANISYLTGKWSEKVLKRNQNINEIISFDDKIICKKDIFSIWGLRDKIKNKNFDIAFILDKSYIWNLFAFLSKIPFRMGFDRKGEGFPNNINVKFEGEKYELDYYLDIARLIKANTKNNRIELWPRKNDIRFANEFIRKHKLKKIIGIAPAGAVNPGQELAEKRWPKERYIELINKLIKDNYDIILFGGKVDSKINNCIINGINHKNKIINTTGKLTINQTSALIEKCRVFVTNDSGAMHIAAATNTKIIAIFGPTDPKRFAPRDTVVIKKKLGCSPCYDIFGNYKKCKKHNCMNLIKVDDVLETVIKTLKG